MPGIDRFEEMCVISASGSPVISQTESSPTFPVQNSSEADPDGVAGGIPSPGVWVWGVNTPVKVHPFLLCNQDFKQSPAAAR